jgi:hypothetical protein
MPLYAGGSDTRPMPNGRRDRAELLARPTRRNGVPWRTPLRPAFTLLGAICLVAFLAACAGGGGAPTSEPGSTAETAQATATPTAVPPTAMPSPTVLAYSGVLATYPPGTDLCRAQGFLGGQDEGGIILGDKSGNGIYVAWGGSFSIQCYGTKLTVGDRPVTLDGQTYEPGTKLTVDGNLDWVEVSSWE